MKLKILLFFICLSIITIASLSRENKLETISLDDSIFQQYNGKVGRWIYADNENRLKTYIQEFGSSSAEVAMLNPKTVSGNIFVPYSGQFIIDLKKKGFSRMFHTAPPDSWIWPVTAGMKISSRFGYRGTDLHTGIDIPAASGSLVLATMDGQVSFAGYDGGYGNVIDIVHRDNFMTRYGHNTILLVRQGDFVRKGQLIALSGSTGNSTGSHVHYEIRCNDVPLDPLDFLPDGAKARNVLTMQN